MSTLAAAVYLANKPTGSVLIALVVALVLFVMAGLAAAVYRAFWAAIVCAGFFFVVLAFIL